MRGIFIAFEGGEGSGKSTKAKFVYEQLKAEGRDVVLTREPGGSPYAEKIREVILHPDAKFTPVETLFDFFWDARRDHMRSVILPAIARGAIALCDRFDGSTFTYQIYGQENRHLEPVFWERRKELVHRPDHYILYDIDTRTGLSRAKSRQEKLTHFDERDIAFHERVRAGYSRFFTNEHTPISHSIIDAEPPLEHVQKKTLDLVRQLIAA